MSKKRAERERRGILRDYGLAIGGSILVAFFIRFFVIEAYRMPSRAMQPAVEPGDTLFVSKRLFQRPPMYGDVVVFEFVEDPKREYIKRVVALPGDRVSFVKGGLVLNGKSMLEPKFEAEKAESEVTATDLCAKETLPNGYSYDVCFEPPLYAVEREITVPPNQVYVVGDLRTAPYELRRLKVGGLVPFDRLKGRALFIWLSIEPPGVPGAGDGWFSRIRFERLFRRIR